MYEQFSEGARQAVLAAQQEARSLGREVGTGELLLGLCRAEEHAAAKALASLGISAGTLRQQLASGTGPDGGDGAPPDGFTPSAANALAAASREALRAGEQRVTTGHMLVGLAGESDGVAARLLSGVGADAERLRALVEQFRRR